MARNTIQNDQPEHTNQHRSRDAKHIERVLVHCRGRMLNVCCLKKNIRRDEIVPTTSVDNNIFEINYKYTSHINSQFAKNEYERHVYK